MNMENPTIDHVHKLEDALKEAERRIAEFKAERDEALDLVHRMENQVEDSSATINRWIEAFKMQLNDDGCWDFPDVDPYDDLFTKHEDLVKRWNKFIPAYNRSVAPKEIGRPLDASAAQCAQVLKLRKAGTSLREIAEETSLGLQTVRTIVGRGTQTDRASARRLQRIDPERAAANAHKARKRTRDALPKQINEVLDQGAALLKEAKGLGA
jgi:DNA repair exonuclease SbcCD ATPase subunit